MSGFLSLRAVAIPGAAVLLAVLAACGGGSGPAAPGEPPPEAGELFVTRSRMVAPQATDPLIDTRSGSHLVVLPAEVAERKGELLVFYPGTGALPEWYDSITTRAAQRGFHAISLDYENSQSINFDVCPGQPPDCPERARLEILTGEESPYIEPDVDATNSAFNRLRQLIEHEHANHPDEGWDAYLTPAGELAWERIVFAGHSQGGGHAAMTAKLHEVPRVLLFGATEPAAWTQESFATPAERFRGLVHRQEPIYDGVVRSWDNIGIPGERVEIGTLPPPVQTQRLVTVAEGCSGDPASSGYYHNCYIVDGWMPAPAPDGTPAFAPVWDYLLLDDGQQPVVARGDVVTLTPPGESWLDPEVLRDGEGAWMSWQDAAGGIWQLALDAVTGLPAVAAAQIGSAAAPLERTYNGPEYGLDRDGRAVYYTQQIGGLTQAVRVDAQGRATVLTTGDEHFSPMPTQQAQLSSTRLLMLRRPPDWGTVLWLDAADPQSEHDLAYLAERTDGDARWAVGTASFATNAHPDHPGQIVLVDTDSGSVSRVTADSRVKTTPYAWRAPEAGNGSLFVLGVVDDTQLIVWAPDGAGGWREHAVLESPSALHPYLGSPEPFVAGGQSFVSLTVRNLSSQIPGVTDAQVWIVDVDPAVSFAHRCDDGALLATRVDPEVLMGDDQVFVYYYRIDPSGAQVDRCATGVRT